MGQSDYYLHGGWNVICDRCGFKYKNTQIRETWDGLRVCKKCFEHRQPQDFVRGVTDDMSVPWSRPEATEDEFVPEVVNLVPHT